ncbi:MAG: flavoprotein oxidoreductase [Spirochaetaceae bacterium]|nr:MAG: flavoprotein oxidoreductase [Spirochaetaceae bacterium]
MKDNARIAIIGGDAAGMSAASKIRREKPDAQVIVFEKGEHTSYSACGMPYYVSGVIETSRELIARSPDEFREKHGIDVRIRQEVTAIDPENRTLSVRRPGPDTDAVYQESYEKLLIATGASPVRPPVDGIDAPGIMGLSSLQSGIDMRAAVERVQPKRAVVVGGGYIGLEMVESLLELGCDVTLVDQAPQVMATLDKDMASIISDYLSSIGVHVLLNEPLRAFGRQSDGHVDAVLTENHTLPADLVILGLGVRPNSALAGSAGLSLGARDAIRVNRRMETSVPGIWSAGDCAESFHRVLEMPVHIALGTVANKHGMVAGTNMSGGDLEFPGVLGTAIMKVGDLEVARTGVSEREATEAGLRCRTTRIKSRTRAGYYPGSERIHVKLVVSEQEGTILGGQIVGGHGAGKRIDTVAASITGNLSARDLVNMDLSYAPPFSPVWDPVQTAARTLV